MIIDLHGLSGSSASNKVEMKLLDFFDSPMEHVLKIITGNGDIIKDMVIEKLNYQGLNWSFDGNNEGCIIIKK